MARVKSLFLIALSLQIRIRVWTCCQRQAPTVSVFYSVGQPLFLQMVFMREHEGRGGAVALGWG